LVTWQAAVKAVGMMWQAATKVVVVVVVTGP
jgi:hypothetical protein